MGTQSYQNNFNHWWEPHSYMDQSRYGQVVEPHFTPIQRSAESEEIFQRIMNFEPYHVKSMEERRQYQWQQQCSSPIETWEYDQQLCQQVTDVTEQVKSCNERFDKFLERCDSKRYEVTFRNLETQIDEVVDEEKVEREVEKIEEEKLEEDEAERLTC